MAFHSVVDAVHHCLDLALGKKYRDGGNGEGPLLGEDWVVDVTGHSLGVCMFVR